MLYFTEIISYKSCSFINYLQEEGLKRYWTCLIRQYNIDSICPPSLCGHSINCLLELFHSLQNCQKILIHQLLSIISYGLINHCWPNVIILSIEVPWVNHNRLLLPNALTDCKAGYKVVSWDKCCIPSMLHWNQPVLSNGSWHTAQDISTADTCLTRPIGGCLVRNRAELSCYEFW